MMAKEKKEKIDKSTFKTLAELANTLNKQHGEGTVQLGNSGIVNVETISTGSLAIDLAICVGGVPKGRIVEIYGPESAGKTTLALSIIAQSLKNGGNAAFIDAEHALDPQYAKHLGVDLDRCLINQPNCGEEALDLAEQLAMSGLINVIVIDSVPALVPREELEGTLNDHQMAPAARLMSKALRKLTAAASKNGCVIIFLNQIREKVGVSFGNPEVTPGGRALKFFSSVRIEVKSGGKINHNGSIIQMLDAKSVIVGKEMRVKIVKNKVGPPFRMCSAHLMFDTVNKIYGFDPYSELVDIAVNNDIINRSGSWYSYGNIKLGMGNANASTFLRDPANEDIFNEITAKVREVALPKPGEITLVDDSELEAKVDQLDD